MNFSQVTFGRNMDDEEIKEIMSLLEDEGIKVMAFKADDTESSLEIGKRLNESAFINEASRCLKFILLNKRIKKIVLEKRKEGKKLFRLIVPSFSKKALCKLKAANEEEAETLFVNKPVLRELHYRMNLVEDLNHAVFALLLEETSEAWVTTYDIKRLESLVVNFGNDKCKGPGCSHLGTSSCGKCMSNRIKYCTRECQVNHWKEHKKVCKPRATKSYEDELRSVD